jgi:hypothetical protein
MRAEWMMSMRKGIREKREMEGKMMDVHFLEGMNAFIHFFTEDREEEKKKEKRKK